MNGWFTPGRTPAAAAGGGGGTVQGTDGTYDIRAVNEGATAGNARGENTVDLQTLRSASTMVTSGNRSVICGGEDNTVSAKYAVVVGGEGNTVTGYWGSCGGGQSNTASGQWATVGGGQNNVASDQRCVVAGGYNNSTSSGFSAVCGGRDNTIAVNADMCFVGGGRDNDCGTGGISKYAVIVGGRDNLATGTYAMIVGGKQAIANKWGQNAQSGGKFSADGDAQTSVLVARKQTTDGTANVEMFLDGTDDRCTISSDTSWAFTILLISRRTDADGESAAYEFKGCIDNNAGTTALAGSVIKTVIHEDTAAWDAQVTADDTNDSLKIDVTGEVSKTINWVARITLVEVTG